MSAPWSLTGGKRTWRGQPNSVENDPLRTFRTTDKIVFGCSLKFAMRWRVCVPGCALSDCQRRPPAADPAHDVFAAGGSRNDGGHSSSEVPLQESDRYPRYRSDDNGADQKPDHVA